MASSSAVGASRSRSISSQREGVIGALVPVTLAVDGVETKADGLGLVAPVRPLLAANALHRRSTRRAECEAPVAPKPPRATPPVRPALGIDRCGRAAGGSARRTKPAALRPGEDEANKKNSEWLLDDDHDDQRRRGGHSCAGWPVAGDTAAGGAPSRLRAIARRRQRIRTRADAAAFPSATAQHVTTASSRPHSAIEAALSRPAVSDASPSQIAGASLAAAIRARQVRDRKARDVIGDDLNAAARSRSRSRSRRYRPHAPSALATGSAKPSRLRPSAMAAPGSFGGSARIRYAA